MKHKTNYYARAICDLISYPKADIDKIVKNFLKLLKKNGDLNKAKEIILLAERLYFRKIGKRRITIETARKTKNPFTNSHGLVNNIIEEKVNPELIAGVKVIIDDEKQLDFSLKRRLEEIFK
jgi:F0F1-type ATP synthase delta subunit